MDTYLKNLNFFGITSLHPEQEAVLRDIAKGHDVCTVLRTGGGKSLLYQLPALSGSLRDITVVFSPLVSLQMDQLRVIDNLVAQSVKQGTIGFRPAIIINSNLTKKAREHALRRLHTGVQLVYMAPEQLENPDTLKALQGARICRVVIDEAHTLPQSAEGYRKAYKEIGPWIASLDHKPQILTFSATMTKSDLEAVQNSLGMDSPKTHKFPIRRDNLTVLFKHIKDKGKTSREKRMSQRLLTAERFLTQWKQEQKGCAVVFCTTVNQANQTADWLEARDWSVTRYHGKLKPKERSNNMDAFLSGKRNIMVATCAFGLGVDKPDIRLVLHMSPPISFDGYIQEIGRAGRDGKKANCVLLYATTDWDVCKNIISNETAKAYSALKALQEFVETGTFRWSFVEKYFGAKKAKKKKSH